jgi:hypothetical protein
MIPAPSFYPYVLEFSSLFLAVSEKTPSRQLVNKGDPPLSRSTALVRVLGAVGFVARQLTAIGSDPIVDEVL